MVASVAGHYKKYTAVLVVLALVYFIQTSVVWRSPTATTSRIIAPVRPTPTAFPLYLKLSPSQEPDKNVTRRLIARSLHLQTACDASSARIERDKQRLANSKIYQTYYAKQPRIVIDKRSKLLVCLQAKGGSSFWKYLFLHKRTAADNAMVLTGVQPSATPQTSDSDRDTETLGDIMLGKPSKLSFVSLDAYQQLAPQLETDPDGYTMFVFGRNPWNRLVSLYRQKIEGRVHNESDIAYRYVKAACAGLKVDTFLAMLKCVLTTWARGFPDRHWEPLTTHCDLCGIPYQYIGFTEHMNEEATEILKRAGLKGDLASFVRSMRTQSMRRVEVNAQKVDYKEYYKDIPNNVIHRLQNMYSGDITLLGYPATPL